MSGIRMKNALKPGESFTGLVSEVTETSVVFEMQEGSRIKIPFPENVLEEINDDHNSVFGGDIITVSREGEEYVITEHEEWPKSEEKPKK